MANCRTTDVTNTFSPYHFLLVIRQRPPTRASLKVKVRGKAEKEVQFRREEEMGSTFPGSHGDDRQPHVCELILDKGSAPQCCDGKRQPHESDGCCHIHSQVPQMRPAFKVNLLIGVIHRSAFCALQPCLVRIMDAKEGSTQQKTALPACMCATCFGAIRR